MGERMRRILATALTAVLLCGSLGSSMVRADGINPAEMGQKWVKFSEKIKINKENKISPYMKLGANSNYTQIIVETKVQPLYAKSNEPSSTEKQHQQIQLDQLRTEIMAISPKIKVDYIFKNLFTGFALSVPANKVSSLTSIANVQSIHPVLSYKALGSPTKALGAETVWGMKDGNGASVTGKGIKVGIVDTGIDYNHPDLKANYKGGYNAIAKNNDPKDGHGHGTHVAGIIAANGKMKGIAPEASIYSYRVLNNHGSGTNATIIAGIDKAIEDKVDVMNLSLGGSENTPDDPLALALNKAVEKGITVAVANGNDGDMGNWTVGTPATAEGVISVGASSLPSVQKGYELTMNNPLDKSNPIQINVDYLTKTKAEPGTKWEVVDVGTGNTMEDYKGKNVKGKMVLASGPANSDILIANAEKAGAVAILSEMISLPTSYKKTNMALFSAYIDRDTLKKAMKAGAKIFTLKQSAARSTEEIASFSSRGMVQGSWAVKPDVVAPGVSIKSTVPKKLSKNNTYDKAYDSWDGTSMASPQVAGAAVLLKQMHPSWKPVQIKAALSNTAKDLMDPNTGKSYMVKEQGSGRIDIPRAIGTTTLVTPNNLTFGLINPKATKVAKKKSTPKKGKKGKKGKKSKKEDSDSAATDPDDTVKVEKSITIQNMNKAAKVYTTLVELVNGHKGTKISVPAQIKVDANSTKSVSIKASIQRTMPRGIYTGRLFLREKGGQQYIVPFTFCIDPKTYARINYLNLSEEFISPLSKKAKGSTEVLYYIPNAVKYVTIYLSGDKLKPTIIHEAHDVTTGWKKFQWDGTLDGKPLPDGIYTLEAVAKDEFSKQQDLTQTTAYVYSNGPKLTTDVNNEEGTVKLQVEHELAVLGYFVNSFLSMFGMSIPDWVNVQYQLQGTDKWVKLPLAKGKLKKKKGTQDDLTGKMELSFSIPYSWMKSTNDTVTIRATDKAGNQTKVEVKIQK